jgi:hypothetical protein
MHSSYLFLKDFVFDKNAQEQVISSSRGSILFKKDALRKLAELIDCEFSFTVQHMRNANANWIAMDSKFSVSLFYASILISCF